MNILKLKKYMDTYDAVRSQVFTTGPFSQDLYSSKAVLHMKELIQSNGKYSPKLPMVHRPADMLPMVHRPADMLPSCLILVSVLFLMLSVIMVLPLPLSLIAGLALLGPLLVSLVGVIRK